MQYHLFVCRHAEAQVPRYTMPDHDRPLSESGRREAELAGQWLRISQYKVDIILCSSANRTLSTARIIANEINHNQEGIFSFNELYNAPAKGLLPIIESLENNFKSVLIVGHNPGISNLIGLLTGRDSGPVPTGSVHHLWFEAPAWQEITIATNFGYETNLK